MTTELEQEFFNMFGIEPEINYVCDKERCRKGGFLGTCADTGCSRLYDVREDYPEIAAEKLLRMEDILLRKHIQIEYCFYNGNYYSSCTIALCNGKSDNKKDAFLEMLISIAQNFLDNCDTDGEEEIYKQIQQLFKEREC